MQILMLSRNIVEVANILRVFLFVYSLSTIIALYVWLILFWLYRIWKKTIRFFLIFLFHMQKEQLLLCLA